MDQIDNLVNPDLFEYENVLDEIKSCLVNKTCVLMTIENKDDSIANDDYDDWFDKVFTNEGTDDSVARMRDIFDPSDNFEYLGCNADLSKEIVKKLSAQA